MPRRLLTAALVSLALAVSLSGWTFDPEYPAGGLVTVLHSDVVTAASLPDADVGIATLTSGWAVDPDVTDPLTGPRPQPW